MRTGVFLGEFSFDYAEQSESSEIFLSNCAFFSLYAAYRWGRNVGTRARRKTGSRTGVSPDRRLPFRLNAEWARHSATILHRYVESELDLEGEVAQRTLCRVIDVFAGKVYEAPGTFKARRENVEAACWHIKNSWDSITPSDR
jgi:hypothetical protein